MFSRHLLSHDRRRLIVNLASLFSLKGIDVLVPLLVAPYLIRVVGLEKFGLIAFSLSFSAYFSAVINYGFNITATRDISRLRNDLKQVSLIYNRVLISIGFLAISSGLIFAFLISYVPKLSNDFWLFAGAFFLTVMQSALPTWFFAGYERMGFIATLGAASKLAYIASLFVFINSPDDYIYVNFLYGVSALVTLLLSVILVRYYFGVKFVRVSFPEIVETLQSGFSVFVMQMAPALYNNSSVFILGLTASPAAVGIYSAAMKIVEVATTVGRIAANVFLPYISADLGRHSEFSRLMFLVGSLITALLMVFSSQISIFLYGESGASIGVYLKWLSLGVFLGFMYLVYGVNYLTLVGKERVAAIISLIVSILGFALLLLFVPGYGLFAVTAVFLLSRSLLSGLSFTVFFRGRN